MRLKLTNKDPKTLTKKEIGLLIKLNKHKISDPKNLQEFIKAYINYLDEHLDMMVDPLQDNDNTQDNRSIKTLSHSQDSKGEDPTDLVSVKSENEIK